MPTEVCPADVNDPDVTVTVCLSVGVAAGTCENKRRRERKGAAYLMIFSITSKNQRKRQAEAVQGL